MKTVTYLTLIYCIKPNWILCQLWVFNFQNGTCVHFTWFMNKWSNVLIEGWENWTLKVFILNMVWWGGGLLCRYHCVDHFVCLPYKINMHRIFHEHVSNSHWILLSDCGMDCERLCGNTCFFTTILITNLFAAL